MVASCVTKMLTTCSPMIGHFLISWLEHQVIKSGYNDPSKSNCWKLFLATLIFRRVLRTATWNLFVLYNKETNYSRKSFFISKSFTVTRKPAFAWQTRKYQLDVIYCLYKMKQSHWLLCVAKNCDRSRKITPLSNLTRASLPRGTKTYSESELNCEIYKSLKKWWKCRVGFRH